ncbi:MAG: sialidase family protein, partial [Candidatus Hydrogenedens sp.]
DLIYKLSRDDGKTWSNIYFLWDDEKNTCGNPCPVIDKTTGNIIMLMTWNQGDDNEIEIINGVSKDTRRVFIAYSTDNGQTWTKPDEITTTTKHPDWSWYATGPGIGIQMTGDKYKNRLIIPCDHANKNDKQWYSHIIYSDDAGKTWSYSNPVGIKTNECQVVELTDNKLLINMRNYNREYTCRATSMSEDGGVSWTNLDYDLALIEPVCQASLIKHSSKNGDYLIFSNPADKKERIKMTVKISDNFGKTWKYQKMLYEGPSAYSSLYSINENEVGILFECGEKSPYEKIVFQKIDIQKILTQQ